MNKLFVSNVASAAALGSTSPTHAQLQASTETPRAVLAAQIRTQGFACEKALGARKDAKRSRADYEVWILKCSNMTYRVGRYPDMAAKVTPLQ